MQREKPRGGPREKRRVEAIKRKFDEGLLTVEELRNSTSKSLQCYKFWEYPEAEGTTAASSGASACDAPPDYRLIALDLHGCLDDGFQDKHIPEVNKQAVRKLIDRGFRPWILSYIGTHGKHSQSRRDLAEQHRLEIAEYCGLDPVAPAEPCNWALYLEICDSRTSTKSNWYQGKWYSCREWNTNLLVDDNQAIADECHEAGISCYVVRKGTSFCDVIDLILDDEASGLLAARINRIRVDRKW